MAEASAPSVLFITRKWGPRVGGMETWSLRFAEHLAEQAQVEVLALPSPNATDPPSPVGLLRFALDAVLRVLRGDLPDVVHVGDLSLWPIAWLASLRRPTFVTVHGSDVAYATIDSPTGRAYRAYLAAARPALRSVNLLPNSRATARQLRQQGLVPDAPVYLGADPTPAPVNADDPASGGSELLFTGRLMERKGLSWFVREVLDDLPPDITLLVAGPRWDADEVAAVQHPRVTFLGPLPQDELHALRRRALAIVVPNRRTVAAGATAFEGFGLVAVEAATDGGLVLASDVHGLQDAVVDGVTGLLLPPDDASAWIAAINRVRAWSPAQRHEFVHRARTVAQETFTWKRTISETLKRYERALTLRPGDGTL